MISPSRLFGAVCVTAVVGCLVACAGVKQAAERQKRTNDLKMIGIALHSYADSNNGNLPPDQATFAAWAQKMQPEVAPIIQSGKYTIVYARAKLTEIPEGASNVVVAYDNTPDPAGRLVLMGDASTRIMPEGEFQTAPKLKSKQ